MGLTRVSVTLRVPGSANGAYEPVFLVDTGATDSMAPASELAGVGIVPVGRTTCELADRTRVDYTFGLAQIEFMSEITAGRDLRTRRHRADSRRHRTRIRRDYR